MLSVRLSDDMEKKLSQLAKKTNHSKSDIVKEALNEYIVKVEKKEQPYELGKDLFGKYGSSDGSLSSTYKKKIREKINEKNAH